jgi:hypothetical protein
MWVLRHAHDDHVVLLHGVTDLRDRVRVKGRDRLGGVGGDAIVGENGSDGHRVGCRTSPSHARFRVSPATRAAGARFAPARRICE